MYIMVQREHSTDIYKSCGEVTKNPKMLKYVSYQFKAKKIIL